MLQQQQSSPLIRSKALPVVVRTVGEGGVQVWLIDQNPARIPYQPVLMPTIHFILRSNVKQLIIPENFGGTAQKTMFLWQLKSL